MHIYNKLYIIIICIKDIYMYFYVSIKTFICICKCQKYIYMSKTHSYMFSRTKMAAQ